MPRDPATAQDTREHGWCMHLLQLQAFQYFLGELERIEGVARSKVCAEDQKAREFQAGRLSALIDARTFVAKRYAKLKDIVEVVPE